MKKEAILKHIDYTVLKAHTRLSDIISLCDDAIRMQTASVCIPPSYVRAVKERYGSQLQICTVIGFPLGYSTQETKAFETQQALSQGADEIDVVINLGHVKNRDYPALEHELKLIREVCDSNILKVIIETCYLETDEIVELTKMLSRLKVDHIKTSTGFGSAGATFEHIELINQHKSKELKIKASGGIRSLEDMERYLSLGVDRLGVSSIEVLK